MENNIDVKRHSLAHILAQAVLELRPEAKLGMGPAIENGFYYDFDITSAISTEDLPKINAKMIEIIESDIRFEKSDVSIDEAKQIFAEKPYKLEIVKDLQAGGATMVTVYKSGNFTDLCHGPHISSTSEINVDGFRLTRVAGAYWKNNEKNKQLQRVYGVAFESKEELSKHLENIEEAQKRDHRKLGRDLDLFTFHEEAPGMVFWHDKGIKVVDRLVDRWRAIQAKHGYKEVRFPNMLDVELWKRSGHYEHYQYSMFFTDNEGKKLALRPMDCPGAILYYGEDIRSYNELPLKLSELGTVFRNENSGELHGLFRVQQITQDDAHVFVTPEQIEDQVAEIINIMEDIYKPFNMKREIFLSTKPVKAMGSDEMWSKAEAALRSALDRAGVAYGIKDKDGAFYGPKIDVHINDSLGRSWQMGTVQLDFFMPQQFGINYIAEDGTKKTPVIIHRALMGSLERFVGILTEHYAGAFPTWLAPVQAVIIPVSEKHNGYACSIVDKLTGEGVRAEVDSTNETLGKKIRAGEIQKIPLLLIVGDREVEAKTVALRSREKGDEGSVSIDELTERINSDKQ